MLKNEQGSKSDKRKKRDGVTLKELIDRGVLPENFHLFSLQEMKEYHKKINKKRREDFNKRLEKYDFEKDIKW